MIYLFTYALIRVITLPLAYLPYPIIHFLGKHLGSLCYFLLPRFRKRALSNLALAKDLALSNEQIRRTAKASFQNLMITCLEFPKLAKEKEISKIAICENPEKAYSLIKPDKGVIFFCGHLSNWELLFLEGTSRMKGVAIGRPIKNRYLYNWVLQMRQKFGEKSSPLKTPLKRG